MNPIVEEITRDFLDRDSRTFVRARKDGRINWEEALGSGASLSEYFLREPDMEQMLRKAYDIATDMTKVMDAPFKVKVRLTPGGDASCTDSKELFVATDYFDSPGLTPGQKVDIFTGLAVHECCHLLYTDFGVHSGDRMVQTIANILEDERIERLLGESRPGLAGYIEAVKAHYWRDAAASSLEAGEDAGPVRRILGCVLGMVRYPPLLKERDVLAFAGELREIRKVLLPYPASTREVLDAAQRIVEIIRKAYSKDEEKRSAEGSKADGRRTAAAGGGQEAGESDSPESSPAGAGTPGESGKEGMDAEADRRMRSDFRDVEGMLERLSGSAEPTSEMVSGALTSVEMLPELIEGRVERGSVERSFWIRPEGSEKIYRDSLDRVWPHIQRVRQALKYHCLESDLELRGMRSGALDTSKLAEAVQGDGSVYIQERTVKCPRRAVCILLDESGSMIREGRERSARDAAVLLNEALKDIRQLDLFIYGHTADVSSPGTTDMRVYRERGHAPRWALGSYSADSNNRDGDAIMEAALRVRRQTREHVLMFIISDGTPAAEGYIGRDAVAHTRETVAKVRAMGFTPVQVCISPSYDPSEMFDSFIILDDLATLAQQLSKVIRDRLLKDIRRTVSR